MGRSDARVAEEPAATMATRVATLAAPWRRRQLAAGLRGRGAAAMHRCATLLAFAFGWAENMVQAALKAVPLGQSAGQRVLAALVGAIPAAVDDALAMDDDRPPGLRADAGHPLGAARDAVLAPVPFLTRRPPALRAPHHIPAAPKLSAAARRRRRAGRLRQDHAGRDAVQDHARALGLVVVTNDIYTKEDQRLLTVASALEPERIVGVETGGCPHTAIRGDASINLEAVDRMLEKFPDADIVFIGSGGDNLAATFSPELSDLTIYVIDVAAGEKIPRKGGPGITKSDLFVINKTDLRAHVGADLDRDGSRHRSACGPITRASGPT